jgi:hypothetical protein
VTTRFEKDFAELREHFPSCRERELPSGARLIEIPDYKLVPGWSQATVTILFVAPVGFPGAQPDCFWVTSILRVAGGGTPQATNDSNAIPEVGQVGTWFSWHVQDWNANRSSLLTYMRVIEVRLAQVK